MTLTTPKQTKKTTSTAYRLLSSLLVIVLAISFVAPAVSALTPEQRQLFDDAIYYYNDSTEEIKNCGPGVASVGGANADPTVESDNVRIAYEFFVAKGLAPFRSAGIVGNLQVEAPGLDPNINQGGGGPGRGIAQWSVNGRWVDLQAFAAQRGMNERDLTLQLEFIWHEMNNVAPWNKALPGVQGATDLTAATRAFMELYEKPGIPNFAERVAAAEAVLALYGAGAPASGPAAAGGTTAPAAGGAAGGGAACPAVAGNFTGAPGQTKAVGEGFSLNDNTDYTGTPCAAGSTESRVYLHPVAGFQIRVCVIDGTSIDVASIVSDRVVAMISDARGAGVTLNGGGFRTYEEQLSLRSTNGCSVPAGPSNAGCSPPTASPGNSQHERGLAIDFAAGGGSIRMGSPQFNWLSANASKYGYFNLPIESWHWSTSGR